MCYNVALTYVQVKVACSIILMTGVRCTTIIQSLDSVGKVLVKKKKKKKKKKVHLSDNDTFFMFS